MSEEEINVFKLENPRSFYELLAHSEFIVNDIEKCFNKLKETISIAQAHRELISEDETKDALHNLSQNIIDLSKLIQKKIWGD